MKPTLVPSTPLPEKTMRLPSEVEDNEGISHDRLFQVLSNERRRLVLRYLSNQERERIPLRDVVDQVAAWENNTSIAQLRSADRKCVYTALRQSHLPKLEREGIIEFDQQRSEIGIADSADQIASYLGYLDGEHDWWSQTYLSLSALTGVLVVAAWVGVPPFGWVNGVALAAMIVFAFTIASLVHLSRSQSARVKSPFASTDR